MKAPAVDLSAPHMLLRFTDGLIVDRSRCPLRLQAHSHWRREFVQTEPGQPNAVCLCDDEEGS